MWFDVRGLSPMDKAYTQYIATAAGINGGTESSKVIK